MISSTNATLESAQDETCTGRFRRISGQDFYQVQNYDRMAPFLMSVVSSGDHWIYVSSTGGLTAGRVSAEHCLFPYETVDRLHDCYSHTGPLTLIRWRNSDGQPMIWQPFKNVFAGAPGVSRRLLKHVAGDQVVFEETNEGLGLAFRYGWRTSPEYGIVRTAELENLGSAETHVELIDGLQNLCPSGVPLTTYQRASCLVDAYKHNEIDPATGMGLYSLTAQILDRAEAAEVLRATTVWRHGLPHGVAFLSRSGVREFSTGGIPCEETLSTGQRGNYFTYAEMPLAPGESRKWHLAADVARDHEQVAALREMLSSSDSLESELEGSIRAGHDALMRNVASADGLQKTGSQTATAHHFANVLFNNMRGGVFAENYQIKTCDFIDFITARNRPTAQAERAFLRALPDEISHQDLAAAARQQGNPNLVRLALEYLPLTFSRRHGDPSRPWNEFEIRVNHKDGSKIYNYQGNWRDIFQNWEALCQSFPLFLPSIVAKFVNASTVDGFNPYRITRDGIDWETPNPEDPWSNIGYWGDHQIIYLTKLLEALRNYLPGELGQLMEAPIFCYANVPYRIRPYHQIVENSCQTIDYDQFTAREINRRIDQMGADGKLVLDSRGDVVYVNLIEKLLTPVLAKLSNLAVDGGIWLNTQRPEWNDANNALVGSGLSVVTVCYLRRHLKLLVDLLGEFGDRRVAVSVEVEQWFRRIRDILQQNRSLLQQEVVSDAARGSMLEAAGQAFSDYRLKVYEDGFSGNHTVSSAELVDFFRLAMEYLDHSIRANRRPDRLYHAYNLLDLNATAHSAGVSHLSEMLEGQAAILSSGLLDAGQAIDLVDAMYESRLYREDQRSFMLYPNRKLSGFLHRNQIESSRIHAIELLNRLAEAGDRSIVVRDVVGNYHFHHAICRQAELDAQLDRLAADDVWSELVASDRKHVLDLFEEVFHHRTFTGRSGTMYGYEGLGCIYWHMVSKVLLAIQENVFRAMDGQAPSAVVESLGDAYYLVRGGLSSNKTPAEYGAIPTDPYSHTPMHVGARQPGMTGQVKEEILTRQGELGVRIRDGRLYFQPLLLRRRELCDGPDEFRFFDLAGAAQTLEVHRGSLTFTICQTPVVYRLSDGPFSIEVAYADGRQAVWETNHLDGDTSRAIFCRTGEVAQVDVRIPADQVARA